MRLVIFIYLVLTSLCLSADNYDKEYRKAILGHWTTSKADEYFGTSGSITTYYADGSITHTEYESAKCIKITTVSRAKWQIKNNVLTFIITESQGKEPFPIGATDSDFITLLSDTELVLKTSSGRLAKRTRSKRCLN